MSGINFDPNSVTPNFSSNQPPVPKGNYAVQIISSELKPTKNGAGELIDFKTRIIHGGHSNKSINFNINWKNPSKTAERIGHEQLSAICHACKIKSSLQDTQQLHNIPFVVEVEVTPDGKYNNVLSVEAISDKPPENKPAEESPQTSDEVPSWIKNQQG